MAQVEQRFIDRFWSKVNKTDACWEWQGYRDRDGYGKIYAPNLMMAHRFSVILDGRDPTGKFVCHHCDNPSCVRPDHLFVGTPQDNVTDMMSKGRYRNGSSSATSVKGQDNFNAKLKDDDVKYIKQYLASIKRHPSGRYPTGAFTPLVKKYNVTSTIISNIASGKLWRHI